ncbi:hypothetical protein F5148DRAFT_1295336 [Russula earlei]|uniref:Uncharacterized protein n=1 Tax=Russula earlei TaxID=71964 RepID=A0ACC0TT77_9AGAM|nr:hypothetical protein F5148DRAFT_1295336 [Russula earlei]
MRISSIFAMFCLAGGTIPSLALPSDNLEENEPISDEDLVKLKNHHNFYNTFHNNPTVWSMMDTDARALLTKHLHKLNRILPEVYNHNSAVAEKAKEFTKKQKG